MADCDGHLKRLNRSLRELEIKSPVSEGALCQIMARLTRLNRLKTGIIYIQITRGVARRIMPSPNIACQSCHDGETFVCRYRSSACWQIGNYSSRSALGQAGYKIHTIITELFGKAGGLRARAYEAIMVMPDGSVSEGSSSNIWILNNKNQLITARQMKIF